jgi:polyisoprenoid-binding protein YceI
MSTATAQPIAAGTWTIDKVHSHVGFAVKHMVVSTFRGRFEEYEGSLATSEDGAPRLQGAVNVDSIAVKDENLAGHLKAADFFDSEHYPQIRFVSSAVNVSEGGELDQGPHTSRHSARKPHRPARRHCGQRQDRRRARGDRRSA